MNDSAGQDESAIADRVQAELHKRLAQQLEEVRERLIDHALKLAEEDRTAQAGPSPQVVP